MASPARGRIVHEAPKRILGLEQAVFFAVVLQLVTLGFTFGIIYQKVEDLKDDVTAIKRVLMPSPALRVPQNASVAETAP